MRRAAKIDNNQPEIVAALRKVGAMVQSLAATGDGCPDLLVGFKGETYLMEVKDGEKVASKQKLTADQIVWHSLWPGGKLSVVKTVDEALKEINAIQT